MPRPRLLASAVVLAACTGLMAQAPQPMPKPVESPYAIFKPAPAQAPQPLPKPAEAPPAAAKPAATPAPCHTVTYPAGCCPSACDKGCGNDGGGFQFLKPWEPEDCCKPKEEKKPACEPCCDKGWLDKLLWCPKEEEKNGCNGNGNGKACDEAKCDDGVKVSGWIQAGYTVNFDSPTDRFNFGTNFNNRSNDFMLNQVWLRLEKPLTHENEFNWGFTVDFNFGQDAADFNVLSIGMWENFTGDADTAIADNEDHGFDIPQFYVEAHFPGFITEKGMDVRIGRMLTLHGNELSPAILTRFYSHSYGYFYSWPLSHTGVMTNLHLTDTIDVWNCLVLGWDNVFADNNDTLGYHGMVVWTSCDKKRSFWVATSLGPEGIGRFDSSNDDWRYLVTYDYSHKFGCDDRFELVLHGGNAWDTNLFTGREVNWNDYAANFFYTLERRFTLGARAEWFNDDDGYRTGFADDFYGVTLGATYRPYQNLRIRPEIRFDWADNTRPFNDLSDKNQVTAAMDVIWEF